MHRARFQLCCTLILAFMVHSLVEAAEPPPGFLWVHRATNIVRVDGLGGFAKPRIAIDHAENIYLCTVFTGRTSVALGTFQSSPETSANILLSKLGPDGHLKWVRQIAGAECNISVAVLFDPLTSRVKPNWKLKQLDKRNEGHVYVVGTFRGTADFGGYNLSSETNSDRSALFLATYDSEGALVTARILGSLCSTQGECHEPELKAAHDGRGNITLTGRFGGTATLGSTNLHSPWSPNGIFLAQFDRHGSLRWARHGLSGHYGEIPLVVDSDGGVIVGRDFYDYHQTGTEPDFCEDRACNLAKFASDGSLVWSREGFRGISTLALDAQSNLWLAGTFADRIQLGATAFTNSTPASTDSYLAGIAPDGRILWSSHIEGPGYAFVRDIAVGLQGQLYVSGSFSGEFLRVGTERLSGQGSFFLANYSGSGELQWLKGEPWLCPSPEYCLFGNLNIGMSLVVAPSGTLYVGGLGYLGSVVGRLAADHQTSPPVVSQHLPLYQVVHEGDQTALQLQVTGQLPLAFFWKREAMPFQQTSVPRLALSNLSLTQTERFSVIVSNRLGIAESTPALLVPAPRSGLPQFKWAVSGGGCEWDLGSCVAVDTIGNAYVGGMFKGAAVLSGSNVVSNGEWDYFVAKYDPRGSLVWLVTGGGPQDDELYDMAVDASGGVYVTGGLFNPTTQQHQWSSLKFDNDGRLLWTLDVGGDGVAVDRDGNLIITGTEVGPLPYGRFMAKYDNTGNMLWALTNTAYPTSIGRKIATDPSGNIFLVGKHSGDLHSQATETNYAPTVFIAKYNAAGQLLWSREAVVARYNRYLRVTLALDSYGNSYMTTAFEESLRLGPMAFVVSNLVDTLVASFTPDGELRWAQQIRGQSYVHPEGIAVDGTGTVTIVGAFGGADFGTMTVKSMGLADLFVARFDSAGNFLGARQVAGVPYAIPWGVAVTSNGEALITGQLGEHYCFSPQPFVSFGPHPMASFGLDDFFLARIGRQ
jgi:hypothetical protein